ncbi:MAG TPA: glycosyltransferase family 9 protein [Ignavibacteriaceae bacterium]|nr:glycosyltransferase family 9 protein [Ignavibacteriaceae bacterium]
MKLNNRKISINDLLNRNKLLTFLIHSLLLLFFSIVRLLCKLFTYNDGNVLVVSLHRLGDSVFTIPAIMEIYKQFGKKTHILCFPESVPIYGLAFNDINIYALKRDKFYFGGRIAKASAKRKLKSLNPSTILDITGSMMSASLIFNIRANRIIGTNGKQFRTIYDQFVEFRKEPQLVDIYLDAITPLIKISDRTESKKQKEPSNPLGRILIHPFAGWKEKEWNLKSYITLAGRLNENYSVSLITQNNQLSADVINEIDNLNIHLIRTNSVDELIQSTKECSLFIGNDSGPVNIANFLGKPTFTIYGATNLDYTVAKTSHQVFTQRVLKCSALQNEKFCIIGGEIYNCSGIQCMNLLSVDEVYDNVTPLIKKYCNQKT